MIFLLDPEILCDKCLAKAYISLHTLKNAITQRNFAYIRNKLGNFVIYIPDMLKAQERISRELIHRGKERPLVFDPMDTLYNMMEISPYISIGEVAEKVDKGKLLSSHVESCDSCAERFAELALNVVYGFDEFGEL